MWYLLGSVPNEHFFLGSLLWHNNASFIKWRCISFIWNKIWFAICHPNVYNFLNFCWFWSKKSLIHTIQIWPCVFNIIEFWTADNNISRCCRRLWKLQDSMIVKISPWCFFAYKYLICQCKCKCLAHRGTETTITRSVTEALLQQTNSLCDGQSFNVYLVSQNLKDKTKHEFFRSSRKQVLKTSQIKTATSLCWRTWRVYSYMCITSFYSGYLVG